MNLVSHIPWTLGKQILEIREERGVLWVLHKWEALKKMICMIPNEPVKRHLEKPMNAQGHLYESFSKGNRQKMERKKHPGWRGENSRNVKEDQERKSQNELVFLSILIMDKMGFLKEIFPGAGRIRGIVPLLELSW